jgi:RimJ/RimL family protein N-acetyltransferase
MPERRRYRLDLGGSSLPTTIAPRGVVLRPPTGGDASALAELMLDAYRGTIDYDGEGMEEAIAEVGGYLAGSPLLDHSVVAVVGGEVVSACLLAELEDTVLVGYVMTAAAHKRRGLGRLVTIDALGRLHDAGRETVDAWITVGNLPSERVFVSLGFAPAP